MSRISPFVRGMLVIAVAAAVVVLLSLEPALATAGALLSVAFFLAVAFFLFLLWRDRKSDLEVWSDRGRLLFYGAIVLAVVDIGMFIGLGPSGPEALAFLLVLAGCAYTMFRVWREEHR
jgi:hypothetical protein